MAVKVLPLGFTQIGLDSFKPGIGPQVGADMEVTDLGLEGGGFLLECRLKRC